MTTLTSLLVLSQQLPSPKQTRRQAIMPLDHFSLTLPAPKVAPLVTFLTSSLAHLGFKEHTRYGPYIVGLGEETAYFWLAGILSEDADEKTVVEMLKKQHIAFAAESKSS